MRTAQEKRRIKLKLAAGVVGLAVGLLWIGWRGKDVDNSKTIPEQQGVYESQTIVDTGEENNSLTIVDTGENNNSATIVQTIVGPTVNKDTKVGIHDLGILSATKTYSPAGSITKLKTAEISSGSVGRIDLTDYPRETFSFVWNGELFNFGFSENANIPKLTEVAISDEISSESTNKVSDLLAFENTKFLFIEPSEELTDLEIHLYDPYDVQNVRSAANDASGYNSGPGYSSLPIIKREEWSTDASINDPRLKIDGGRLEWEPYYYSANKIIVHHTATPNDDHSGEYWMRAIYNYHAYTNGWGDVGYNYLVDKDGNIYEGKLGGDEAKGYHAGTGNPNSIGVSIIGDYSNELPSYDARYALRKLIAEKAAFYNFMPQWGSTVYGHRDWSATACPGQTFYDQLPTLTANAKTYYDGHYSKIKSVVSYVNDGVDNGTYEAGKVLLVFDDDATLADLKGLIPFYNDQPVSWTGVTVYGLKRNLAWLTVDYDIDPDIQNTTDRVRTLYKIFSLRSEVKAAGLNFVYFTQER
ncbi:MAG: peptidoglycan recognition family protein [Patescibacteria group bacterium]|nr:peptidoglycan recognition protein family protein [Patescibacteria group bacterium]